MVDFKELLQAKSFDKQMIMRMLNSKDEDYSLLLERAREVQNHNIGKNIHGRALIELSNICKKDCYYCGIRKSNDNVNRYILEAADVKKSIDLAIESNIHSLAIQSGEVCSPAFTKFITELLQYTKSKSPGIGITLSCGEQTKEVYQEWFDNGAERYLLRIESATEELYYKIHPKDKMHNFQDRLKCLQDIKDIGYQTGTGIMIGLPEQTIEILANDIIFMRDFDIDMCGMGPFIPCVGTPLSDAESPFDSIIDMSLRVIAILRIIMKDINMVSSTAMETIHPEGRKLAILAGANIIMPNINPTNHRKEYALYNKKPSNELSEPDQIIESCRMAIPEGYDFVVGEKGNSKHYSK